MRSFLCVLGGVAIGLVLGLVVVGTTDQTKMTALENEAAKQRQAAKEAAAENERLQNLIADEAAKLDQWADEIHDVTQSTRETEKERDEAMAEVERLRGLLPKSPGELLRRCRTSAEAGRVESHTGVRALATAFSERRAGRAQAKVAHAHAGGG